MSTDTPNEGLAHQPPPPQQPPYFAQQPHQPSQLHQPQQSTPRRSGMGAGVVVAVAVAAVLGGGVGAGATLFVTGQTPAGTPVATPTQGAQTITISDPADVDLITAVAAKATPSVVTLTVSAPSASGTGSGVVLTADGYVVTNNHVVTLDGASRDATISVTTSDGRIYQAEIVGTDPTLDLAVIKLQDASGLTPITVADASNVDVGDTAVVIGAPLGLASSVTTGVVSALNRSITVASSEVPDNGENPDAPGQPPYNFWQYGERGGSTRATTTISLPVIQTDASINPGNSGGALLNAQGELIGVNVAIASAGSTTGGQAGSIGIGFAIPADVVTRVTGEIMENGEATHGLLGATVSNAAEHENATVAGAYIESVVDGGAAAEAGLEQGDVIISFNGHPVSDATDLTAQVRALAAGASSELEYVRDGQTYSLQVTLGDAGAQ